MKYVVKMLPLAILAVACGQDSKSSLKEGFNTLNKPSQMDYSYLTGKRGYVANFAQLPLKGKLEETPWSDTYYPTYKGGITYRWNSRSADSKRYSYPIRYTESNLISLSPAEKYDIFLGDRSMTMTNDERDRTEVMKTVKGSSEYEAGFKIPTWEGLCHAWAPATMAFQEPKAVEVTNSKGVTVPFGSSDIKALLTYMLHLNDQDEQSQSLGGRCYEDFAELTKDLRAGKITAAEYKSRRSSSSCRDTNAGAFHIVIANQLGMMNEGFVADITTDAEVWNQPIYKFSSRIVADDLAPSRKAAKGTVKEVEIETTLGYITEVDQSYNPNNSGSLAELNYHYRVELNAKGDIIGGEWIVDNENSNEDRPDFLWKRPTPSFSGKFKELGAIYKASIE